jgi:hypothetical protein
VVGLCDACARGSGLDYGRPTHEASTRKSSRPRESHPVWPKNTYALLWAEARCRCELIRSLLGKQQNTSCHGHAGDGDSHTGCPIHPWSRCGRSAPSMARLDGSTADDVHTAALEMNEEQHVVGHQPSQRENLDSEEVGCREQREVSPNGFRPGGRRFALRRRRYTGVHGLGLAGHGCSASKLAQLASG